MTIQFIGVRDRDSDANRVYAKIRSTKKVRKIPVLSRLAALILIAVALADFISGFLVSKPSLLTFKALQATFMALY